MATVIFPLSALFFFFLLFFSPSNGHEVVDLKETTRDSCNKNNNIEAWGILCDNIRYGLNHQPTNTKNGKCSTTTATAFLHYHPCKKSHGHSHLKQQKLQQQLLSKMSRAQQSSPSSIATPFPSPSSSRQSSNNNNVNDEEGEEIKVTRKKQQEWISGKEMMEILEREERNQRRIQQLEQQQQRQQQQQQQQQTFLPNTINANNKQKPTLSSSFDPETMKFQSKITYSDANTLQIDIPPSGFDSNALFSGAFSTLWFSAIAPATVSMIGGGGLVPALFMTPFWVAGGAIAKMAIYDPFISSKLIIGEYAWSLTKNIFKRKGGITTKKEEGASEYLKGATVNLAVVVNNVPKYELLLYYANGSGSSDGGEDGGFGKQVGFGRGLALEELEYLAGIINEHRAKI